MPGQTMEHQTRQYTRAKQIAEDSLAAPASEQVGIKGLAPDVIRVASQYLDADKAVKESERIASKERTESDTAKTQLMGCYDELLGLATHKAGFDGGAASTYATQDDFIAGAEGMEEAFLEHQGEPWADDALAALSPAQDAAAKEYAEDVAAQRALQKAQLRRVAAAAEARTVLVPFRQVVRSTFGRTSREYRDLADRRTRTKPAAPGPAAPVGA